MRKEIRLKHAEMEVAEQFNVICPYLSFGIIEKVHSGVFHGKAKMGVVSAFTFGQSFGLLKGIIAANRVRHEYLIPNKWQTVMGTKTGGDKNISKNYASQLFPDYKVVHANADALLIAELARRIAIERGWA